MITAQSWFDDGVGCIGIFIRAGEIDRLLTDAPAEVVAAVRAEVQADCHRGAMIEKEGASSVERFIHEGFSAGLLRAEIDGCVLPERMTDAAGADWSPDAMGVYVSPIPVTGDAPGTPNELYAWLMGFVDVQTRSLGDEARQSRVAG